MSSIEVFAPGKLFVIGEYAVLQGGRALVAAVDAGIRCRLEERTGGGWLSAPDLGVDASPERALRHPAAHLLADAMLTGAREFAPGRSFRVVVEANHPATRRKRGLGASAASAVAILGAMATAAGEEIERSEIRRRLFLLALDVHRRYQRGRGSGADVAASVYGGWVDFSGEARSYRILPGAIPQGFSLSAAWSGFDSDTGAALESARQLEGEGSGPSAVQELCAVLDRFWGAVDAGDHPRILQTISDYGDLLAGLGPESASDGSRRIAELVHAARRAGAGAKGSGAVGGDSAIAVGFERATLAMVEENWRQLGAEVLGVGVDVRGVRKEVDLARRHH